MSDVIRSGVTPPAIEGLARVTAVDWGAILAGVAVTTAISFVLAAFGTGVGLSLASPYEGASPFTHALALALWVLWVTVASYAAGGYVCGRLRRRAVDVPRDEVEARDGAHGLVVWATALLIAAFAAGSSLYNLGKAGVETAAQQAQKSGASTPVDYRVDTLLRGAPGGGAQGQNAQGQNVNDARQIVSRIVARGQTTGEISQDDRNYLIEALTGTGMSPSEARARVDALAQQVKDDNAHAREIADKARKAGIVASFIAAAAMLLAAASAWGGATLGGRHRDENLGFSAITRW